MIISCIAIDDEILALNKIKRFISKVDFIELKNSFDNAKDAIEYLKLNTIDLVFLDIEMPEITGFQFLNLLNNKPYIILTTAFDQYALKSYDFEVNDYLLKPIQFDRFLKSIERIYTLVKKNNQLLSIEQEVKVENDHFYVKSSGKVIKIFFDDILYIEGMKDYLSIHTTEKRILTLMSFDKLMLKLPAQNFIRVHKSFLVSIQKINEYNSYEVEIGNTNIPISRTFKNDFLETMKKIIK